MSKLQALDSRREIHQNNLTLIELHVVLINQFKLNNYGRLPHAVMLHAQDVGTLGHVCGISQLYK